MKGQKQSRVDKVEKLLNTLGEMMMQQDQAIRWLVKEVKGMQEGNIGEVEKDNPNQLKFDFGDEEKDETKSQLDKG